MDNTTSKSGLWLGEFTDTYYEFIDKGYEVTLASPRGGRPPIDPLSELTKNITSSNRRFRDDDVAQQKFNNTFRLEEVHAKDFDGLFIPGGHVPVWDLATNDISGRIILDFLASNKPVAAVCHGPAALLKAAELQPDLLRGKELGAKFESDLMPFTSHVVKDGLLITGQNPLSAGPTAEVLNEVLENKMV